MTVTELRDRLDDRFRLLVGSRQRIGTPPNAAPCGCSGLTTCWTTPKRTLLARCSVVRTAGSTWRGRVQSADTDRPTGDTRISWMRLVRKSLLIADQASGRTRFSMLETIRQFVEEQLVTAGDAEDVRTAHARYFAERENDVFALWDGPRQQEAYSWVTVEMANLRAAFPVGRRPRRPRHRSDHRPLCGVRRFLG